MGFLRRLFGFGGEHDAPEPRRGPGAEELHRVIHPHLKKASVAEVGGFPPPDDPLTSWFGGHGVALPSEPIPEFRGEKMFPILQVNCAELPYRPAELDGIALLVVWTSGNAIEALADNLYGEGFAIREYASLEGLVPVSGISKPQHLKALPIRWTLVEDDAPDLADVYDIIEQSPIAGLRESDEWKDLYYEGYPGFERTKIGGYPFAIQNTLSETDAEGTFVFQIAHERKANWDWVDAGIAYFFRSGSGEWQWDCQFS